MLLNKILLTGWAVEEFAIQQQLDHRRIPADEATALLEEALAARRERRLAEAEQTQAEAVA